MINRTESALIAQERRNQASKNRQPQKPERKQSTAPVSAPRRTTH